MEDVSVDKMRKIKKHLCCIFLQRNDETGPITESLLNILISWFPTTSQHAFRSHCEVTRNI